MNSGDTQGIRPYALCVPNHVIVTKIFTGTSRGLAHNRGVRIICLCFLGLTNEQQKEAIVCSGPVAFIFKFRSDLYLPHLPAACIPTTVALAGARMLGGPSR